MSKHVFVSYVREDSAVVDRLVSELKAAGIRVWLDRDDLPPGSRWEDAIRQAITHGAFFICCISTRYLSRERSYMNEELLLAIDELRKRPADKAWFLPVVLDSAEIPDRKIGPGETLRSLQHVSLSTDWTGGIQKLVGVIDPDAHRTDETDALKAVRKRAKWLIENELTNYDDEDGGDTFAAMRELKEYGIAVLDDLIEALHHRDGDVIWRSATIIGSMGPIAYRAVPHLIALINEDMKSSGFASFKRWQYSVVSLGKIRDPQALPFLVELLKSKQVGFDAFNWWVKGSLVAFGSNATPQMLDAFKDPSDDTKSRVFMVLTEIDKDQARQYADSVRSILQNCSDEEARNTTQTALDELSTTSH
jgi:hypothetical protein